MDQVPDTAQHYIECDTESCRNFSEFYCNTCHQRICDQCREVHLKQRAGHEIVGYEERKRKLPSEKCKIHPTQDIDVYCKVCQDPLCITCFDQDHSDHDKSGLEPIYNDILQECQGKITDLWKTDIPSFRDNVNPIGEKKDNVKKEIAKLKVSMKERADELKKAVDSVLTDYNVKLDEIENSVLNDIAEQQKETEGYINYLEKMISDYESRMFYIKHNELIKFHLDFSLATMKRPNKAKTKLPIFSKDSLNKEEIARQFGEIEVDSSEKFTLSSVIKVDQVSIPEQGTLHLSLLPPNKFWASDGFGNLIQSDMKGNILQNISTSMNYMQGNHTVTTEGELLYTDNSKNTVYRVNRDMSINMLCQTGSWKPGPIYSSLINGHILVGIKRNSDQKITRFDRKGRKLQDIIWDDQGNALYQGIGYITENINGDICTSDLEGKRLVVVTASGEYRFSYSGQRSQSEFNPFGICTDVLGQILVCNGYSLFTNESCSSIHMLDIDGQFLSLLLSAEECPPYPCSLCIDDKHNLWVVGLDSPTVSVYTYLQNAKK